LTIKGRGGVIAKERIKTGACKKKSYKNSDRKQNIPILGRSAADERKVERGRNSAAWGGWRGGLLREEAPTD